MLITEPTVEEKNGEKRLIALTVTLAMLCATGIILFLIEAIPALRDEPELIAKIISTESREDAKMEKKAVMKQLRQTSTTAAAPLQKLLNARSTARIVAPDVMREQAGPIGLGEGEFGAGFGATTAGMGSGTTFFGSRSSGRRFLFVLDHSASMSDAQESLRNSELKKALEKLPNDVQYQVILFGGGALYAEPGWTGKDETTEFVVTGPDKKKYVFVPFRGANDWDFKGTDDQMPKARWLAVNSANITRTLSSLGVQKFLGTDWEIALKVAHLMVPPPDVIFFMSDGTGGNSPGPIVEFNQRMGRPRINTFAMQTTDGAKQFFEIANKTGGEFVIINREGNPIKVTDPINLPSF